MTSTTSSIGTGVPAARAAWLPATWRVGTRGVALRTLERAIPILSLALLAGWWWWLVQHPGIERTFDAHAYWATRLAPGMYDQQVGEYGAYLYSPAFAQLIAPLTAVPYPVFYALWCAVNLALLVWLIRPTAAAILIFLPFSPMPEEIIVGNIHLMLAAALVLAVRWPAAWSFLIITKVTPGVGLLWYAVRREWRALAAAGAATAAVVLVSVATVPYLWPEWIGLLRDNADRNAIPWQFIHIPVTIRLVMAAAIVIAGARTGRPWVLPIAALVTLPVIWAHGVAITAAVVLLAREKDRWQARALLIAAFAVVGVLLELIPPPTFR